MHRQINARKLAAALAALTLFLVIDPLLQADSQVSIDTSAYGGDVASVLFDFTGGGSPANLLTISNLTGPQVIFNQTTTGSVTGSLPASANLSDSSFFSEEEADVVLGSALNFDLASTNLAPSAGSFPDEFSLYILGYVTSSQSILPSSDPTGAESLLTIDLTGGASPDLSIYSDLVTVGPVPPPASTTGIPEPAFEALFGAMLLVPFRWRHAWVRMRRTLPAAGAAISVAVFCLLALSKAEAQNVVTGVGQDPSFSISFSGLRLNHATNTFVTTASIRNNSNRSISGPFFVGVTHVSNPDVSLAYAGGSLQDGNPYIALSGPQTIAAGQIVTTVLSFSNPASVAFTITAMIYDEASAPPAAALQCPPVNILSGVAPLEMNYTPPTDSLGRVASCIPASGSLISQSTTVNCMSAGGPSLPASCSFIQTAIALTNYNPPAPQPPLESDIALIPCAGLAPSFAPGATLPSNVNPSLYCQNFNDQSGQATFTIWNYGPFAAKNASVTLSFGPNVSQQAWQFSQINSCRAPVQVQYIINLLFGATIAEYGYNVTCSFADIEPNTGVVANVGLDVPQGTEAPNIGVSLSVDPTQNLNRDSNVAISLGVSPGAQSIRAPQRVAQEDGCDTSSPVTWGILLNTCGVPTVVTQGLVGGFLGAAFLVGGAGAAAVDVGALSATENVVFNSVGEVGFIR